MNEKEYKKGIFLCLNCEREKKKGKQKEENKENKKDEVKVGRKKEEKKNIPKNYMCVVVVVGGDNEDPKI